MIWKKSHLIGFYMIESLDVLFQWVYTFFLKKK